MLNWVFRLLDRGPLPNSDDDVALKNHALHLAQEWGKDWLKPIQARLKRDFPDLDDAEADRLNALAQGAMRAGHDAVYDMASVGRTSLKFEDWRDRFAPHYPWIDD
jgi:hypothetical protein